LPVALLKDLWFRQRYRAANKFVPAVVGAEFDGGGRIEFGIIGPFGAATCRVLDSRGIDSAALELIGSRPAVWVPSSVGVVRDEEFRPAARRAGLIFAGRHNEVLRNVLLDLQRNQAPYAVLQGILERHFGGNLGDVHFDDSVDQFVTATYSAGDVHHDLYSVGSGFLQILQLLAFILSRDVSVVLLDEPDAHLHSSLQRTVIDILDELSKARGLQVVLSTHSKEIINYVDPSRLVLVERGQTSASAASEAASQLAILQSLGEIDNVDAYALVKNKRCLFVEGITDVPIIERLAAKLGLPNFAGDERVVIVPSGGAEKFEHVEQLAVLEAVLGAPIRSFEIRDRDGRTDQQRTDDMAAPPRPLHILERDSIESYLVHPEVIARSVNAVATETGRTGGATADRVAEIVLAATDEMRESALDRLADRYSKDRHRTSRQFPPIAESNEAARRLLDAHWDTLDGRLCVVSGRKLLATVRAKLKEEFGVSFGNPRLVEEFDVSEVSPELAAVLAQVVAVAGPDTLTP
jgi:hypothetical protein